MGENITAVRFLVNLILLALAWDELRFRQSSAGDHSSSLSFFRAIAQDGQSCRREVARQGLLPSLAAVVVVAPARWSQQVYQQNENEQESVKICTTTELKSRP